MKPLQIDSALYAWKDNYQFWGLSGSYVDDTIRVGNKKFQEHYKKIDESFDMHHKEYLPFTFSKFKLDLTLEEEQDLVMSQSNYLKTPKPISLDGDYSNFCSARMKLAWLLHTRPDVHFEVSQAAQITEKMFDDEREKHIKSLNQIVKYATENDISIVFPRLD